MTTPRNSPTSDRRSRLLLRHEMVQLVEARTYHADGLYDLEAACFAAAFSLMLCVGARPEEIRDLEPADLVRDQVDSIRLGERVRMNGNRSRTMPLPSLCLRRLAEFERCAGPLRKGPKLFFTSSTGELERTQLAKAFKVYCKGIGIRTSMATIDLSYQCVAMGASDTDDIFRHMMGYSSRRCKDFGVRAEYERRPQAILKLLEVEHPLGDRYQVDAADVAPAEGYLAPDIPPPVPAFSDRRGTSLFAFRFR